MTNVTKFVLVTFLIFLCMTPAAKATTCSAFAPECGGYCEVTAPPSGVIACQSFPDVAWCISWTAQGEVFENSFYQCPLTIPGIGC